MAYIAASHITNEVVKQFYTRDNTAFNTHLTLIDQHLLEVARTLGITDSSQLELDDNDYIEDTFVQQYLVSWFCMRFCYDKIGLNNVTIEEDKYFVLYKEFKQQVKDMKPQITKDMLIYESPARVNYQQSNNMVIR